MGYFSEIVLLHFELFLEDHLAANILISEPATLQERHRPVIVDLQNGLVYLGSQGRI